MRPPAHPESEVDGLAVICTAGAPAKPGNAGAGAVRPAPCCPRRPRLNLRGRCLLLWRSGVSLARLYGERCTPDLFAGIKKKSTVLPTKYSAFLVENSGIEPLTSCMPCKRSPEPRTHAPPHKVARMNNIRCKNVKIEEITSVSPLERLL